MKGPSNHYEALYALVFAGCVLLALALLAGCGQHEAAAPDARPTVRGQSIAFGADHVAVSRLVVEPVQAGTRREIAIPGRITWDEERTVRVFTPFAGRVTRMLASVGDRVKAGQPLAQMLSPDFGQANADARKAGADLALARRNAERQRELAAQGIVAAKDLQQAEADLTRANVESERARSRLDAYGHSGDSGSTFVLKSPVAGTVVERNLNPGQELRPDQPGAPLFVVTDPTRLWISLDANEADLRALHKGMLLVIGSNVFPEETFAGELKQLSDFVDPTSRTVKLRGDVPNPDRKLKAEMFVSARVRLEKSDTPTVNARAVYLEGVRRFVFVRVAPGTYTRRGVRVGPESDGRMPVYAGLKENEEVVVTGNLFLQQILANARPEQGEGQLAGAGKT